MTEELRIFIYIMTGIICIELVCGILILLRAFLTWAFSPIQPRIQDTVVVRMHRPTALSELVRPVGSREMIMSPSRARRRAQCGCGKRARLCPCLCLRPCPRTRHGQP